MTHDPEIASRVLRYLINERKAGRVTSQNPITKKAFLKVIHDAGVELDERTFREIISQLRKDKQPVGSNNGGYFAIANSNEFDVAINDLVSRARDLELQIAKMKEAREDMRKRESSLFEHPTVKSLVEEFDAVIV